MNERELRALIRDRMHAGQLPPALGGKTFAGRGSNTSCGCCGQIIERHETVNEVQFAAHCTQPRRAFIVHMQCHWIWWEESGPHSSPQQSPGSRSLVWSAMRDSLKESGRTIN